MKKLFTTLLVVLLVFLSTNLLAQTAYFTEGFEETAFPSSPGPTTPTEITATTGVWILYCVYRTTSSSGSPVGTADLRVVKTSSVTTGGLAYIVTPKLSEGVGKVSFYEGRGSRLVTLEKSTDDGKTWIFVDTIRTVAKAQNPRDVNDSKANRIRLSNQWTSDCDLDEISVYKYSGGNGIEAIKAFPSDFSLDQNYPNPFNPSTNISFSLPNSSFVKLAVYNYLGQEVSVIKNELMMAGNHNIEFNAKNLPAGVYIYRLITPFQNLSKKMILNK